MRATAAAVLAVLSLGCGKSDVPDAGTTALVDAGPQAVAPVCLADPLDASVDAGWDGGLVFSCRGQQPAAGGQAEFVVTGTTAKAGFTRTALPGVQVELLTLEGAVLASTLSGDGGVFRLAFDAGCAPVDGEVRATVLDPDAGFSLSYSTPAAPWRHDRAGLDLVLFDSSTRALAAAIANVTLGDGLAVLAVTVVDCEGHPVEGAQVVATGDAGVVRYVGASGLPTTNLTATGPTGDLVLFNVPGSRVEVTATRGGSVIGQRTVPVHPDAASGTFLAP